MADSIGQAYVQILPTTRGFSSKLSAELSGGVESAGKSLGGKIISGLAAAGIGIAITKGIKDSIAQGAELEQNLGGTEAVFGKFADNIQKKSTEAYKNMGLSASNYMQTANKMGSLFQGSGIEQEKALKMTSDAMQRAADVASVMGIDTQAAMESVAGAAKGNFTMMDNLGVAMNATTLEAYALEKGINFEWKTASNAEKSELAMKMFMDRTSQYAGNFAKESEETLSGSMGAMKALVQDLMGNLAIGADITPQISALLETGEAFLVKNLLPMIENVITGVANNAPQLASTLSELILKIGDTIITIAPVLLSSGVSLVTELAKGLIQGLPELIPSVFQLINDLALTLTDPQSLGELVTTAIELVKTLAYGLLDALPVLAETIPEVINNVVTTLIDLLPELVPVAVDMLFIIGETLLSEVGLLTDVVFRVGDKLIETFKNTDWKKIGGDIISGISKGLENAKERLMKRIREIADLLPDAVKKVLKISSPSRVMADIGQWIPIGLAKGITDNARFVSSAIDDMLYSNPLLTNGRATITASVNADSYSSADIYNAVKRGASEAQPIIVLNGRVLSRELKGMGVSFA